LKFQADEFGRLVITHHAASNAAGTDNGDTNSVDVSGFREALVFYDYGTVDGPSPTPTIDVSVEDSADGTTFAAIAVSPAPVFAQRDGSVSPALNDLGYVGSIDLEQVRQFLRIVVVTAGINQTYCAGMFLMHPKIAPAAQVNTLEFRI